MDIFIQIPDLGIASYFISEKLQMGCCDEGRFQGMIVRGKHYLVRTLDINDGVEKNGMLIPPAAYELTNYPQILMTGEPGKIKDITDTSILEKIATQVHSDEFEGYKGPDNSEGQSTTH